MITFSPIRALRQASLLACCRLCSAATARLAARSVRCGLAVAAFAAALTACQDTVDDYFPQSATERLQSTVSRVRQVLRSAEYGWELEYYPHPELKYGGIVYTVRFDSLTATVGCSLMADSTETTYYRLTNDNGPVLTFDTYNSLLHYFSTPSGGEYEAKGGEFEFVIDSIGDDLITLYGKKTRNTMYLRRLKGSPDDYAGRTISIYDNFARSYTGTIGEAQVKAGYNLNGKSLTFVSGADSLTASFTFTDSGIRLYRPLTIGGVTFQTLAFDTETLLLTGLDEGGERLQLQGEAFPDSVMAFRQYEGNYMLRYNDNASSVTCRLVPNRLDGTYRLEGLSPHWALTLKYDSETGYLTLGPQVVGDIDGRSVYFATYSSGGSIWVGEECTFTLKWNRNKFYPAFHFSATDPVRYPVDSALMILLYTDENGQTAADLVADRTWMIGTSALTQNLNSLVKLRN